MCFFIMVCVFGKNIVNIDSSNLVSCLVAICFIYKIEITLKC